MFSQTKINLLLKKFFDNIVFMARHKLRLFFFLKGPFTFLEFSFCILPANFIFFYHLSSGEDRVLWTGCRSITEPQKESKTHPRLGLEDRESKGIRREAYELS